MVSDDKPEERHRHRHHIFIPAGILIGLGVGMLLNQPGPGVLIGLGLGFLASSFTCSCGTVSSETAHPCRLKGMNWIMLVVGIFMILIGIGFLWTPPLIWPYIIAIFLILLGISFAVRGFRH
jgi:hypothetical protein